MLFVAVCCCVVVLRCVSSLRVDGVGCCCLLFLCVVYWFFGVVVVFVSLSCRLVPLFLSVVASC